MSQYTLVLLEASGIQEYVFGSNHLAQNIGASELVARSTTEWVDTVLKELNITSNIRGWSDAEGLVLGNEKVTGDVTAEVVYAGGGNAMLLFDDEEPAKQFVRSLTRKVLAEARGLQLVAGRKGFKWEHEEENLRAVHNQLREELGGRKMNRPVSTPLLGMGVTAACVFTGLPATGNDHDPNVVGKEAAKKIRATNATPRLISATVAHKLRAEDSGKERLHAILRNVRKHGFEFIYDFDQFGIKGESSYIAVIHADANNMGDRFRETARDAVDDHDYVKRLRNLSDSVKRNAREALQETVDYLLATWDAEAKTFGAGDKKISAPERNGRYYLPFRPIVFGGDDTTFVSDGRIGLSLAAKYLQAFTRNTLSDGKPVFARAGVAVVKTHFPFSRAYDLADELIRSAKAGIEQLEVNGELSATVMDWHFSTTGVIRRLEEIRRLEYTAETGGQLWSRPIRVGAEFHGNQWRNWDVLSKLVDAFQNGDAWAGRRNKLIAMRDALRGGPKAFRLFRENYRIGEAALPAIEGRPGMQADGWQDGECGYFDAIEAMDFFVFLEHRPEKEAA